jgi:hypothetical protein
MSIEHLRRVGIDVNRVTNAIAFYESYANTVQDELFQVTSQLASARDRDLVRLNDYRWQLSVDVASSFREAGQWALLIDIDRARRLLSRSGRIFEGLGHAFGLFLLVACRMLQSADSKGRSQRDVEVLLQLNQLTGTRRNQVHDVPEAMYHPQQQAYLLLALCATPEIAERYSTQLHTVCSESPHGEGGTPVGALGIPIRHYWATASALLDGNGDQFIGEHLTPFVNRYMDNVLSARSNKYLWDHAASPVDVADVDAIGVVSLAVQRFGRHIIGPQLYDRGELEFGLPAIGSSLLEIGYELATTDMDRRNDKGQREDRDDYGRDR